MKRMKEQVRALALFDRCWFCSEFSLPGKFVRRHAWAFSFYSRGFGYYIWKPYLIERALLELEEDDVLVYSDVGNHFDRKSASRLREYIAVASRARTPSLAPQLSSNFPEQHWTKREMIRFLRAEHEDAILHSPQFEANLILIVNQPRAREMIRRWNEVYESEPKLFDDSQSLDQFEGFVEHRHDQSAFSILGKQYGIVRLPPEQDDFVLRKRDTNFRKRDFTFFVFLLRNRLLLHRLFSTAAAPAATRSEH